MRQVGVLNDVLDNADKVIAKGRLGPGQMVLADIAAGTFKTNTEIARDVARKHPYKEWLGRSRRLEELGASKGFLKAPLMTAADALKLQASSGALVVKGQGHGKGQGQGQCQGEVCLMAASWTCLLAPPPALDKSLCIQQGLMLDWF